MSRKGENIRKRKDGRWEARYSKGRDDNGKIIYGYLYARTYREVKEHRNRKLAELPLKSTQENALEKTPANADFQSVSRLWKERIRHTIKDSTYANYESLLKNQIIPEMRTMLISEITSQTIAEFIRKKRTQGLSAGSIQLCLSVIKNVLNSSRFLGLSPAEDIRFPRITSLNREVEIMNMQDYHTLEKHLLDNLDNFAFGLLVCMNTGIRVGELSGLRWEDINLEAGKMSIRRTVIRIRNLDNIPNSATGKVPKTILSIGVPKTTNSLREIPLPDPLINYARLLKCQDAHYILTGTSKCMEPRSIQKKYHNLLKTCEIPSVKIHSLRHQFACRWVEKGFDIKSLSEILGHTSVRTTLDLYVHTRPETKRKCINQLMENKK